jgi:hypothetical protein
LSAGIAISLRVAASADLPVWWQNIHFDERKHIKEGEARLSKTAQI